MKNIKIPIFYYNITFTVFLPTELEQMKFIWLKRRIDGGEQIYMKDLTNWCKHQEIQYKSEFHYKKEYPYNLGWRNEERTGKELFLLDYDTKHFKDGETNMTTLKEHLKEVQKNGR